MINKHKHKVALQLLVIYTRFLIGGAFVFASLIKIKGKRFTAADGINEPLNSAWHLFETLYQSGLYWKFIGLGQLIAGFLLMTQRFAKLGALVNFPIISNIFVITLSYYFALTPVITGLMLLANIGLIVWDWDTLKVLINLPHQTKEEPRLENDRTWQFTGLTLFLFTFLYRLINDSYDVFLWAGGCIVVGLVGLIIGLRRKKLYPT